MSRRTLPRAVSAGLLVAALGGPVAGQAPNPWRGETADLPTAPAPRAVAAKPTRQLTIGFGFSSFGGLTGTIEIRDLTTPTPAPVEDSRYKIEGAAPRKLPPGWFVESLPSPRYLEQFTTNFPPSPLFPLAREQESTTAPASVVTASHVRVPEYMPPPKPLPVRAIPPAAP
ncbi:MAG: hypothetical protein U0804_16295 [Gemmataceae bacterium]